MSRLVTSSLSFNASFPFATSFISFQLFPSIWYFLSFVSTLPSCSCTSSFRFKPFMWLRPSIRVNSYRILSLTCLFYCNSSISFVTSFLWFQRPPVGYLFLSFQLLPSVCCQVVHFVTSVLTFHLSVSMCYFFPFVSPLTVRLLLELFRCNSFLSFATAFFSFQLFPSVRPFLSFQLSPFICYFLPFVSTLPSRPLLPSVCFNSLLSFVPSFRSFQL